MKTTLVIFAIVATLYTINCLPQGQSSTERPGFTLGVDEIKYLQNNKGFGPTRPSYKSTVAYEEEEEEEYDDNEPEPSQDRYPTYANQNYPIPVKSTVAKAYPSATPKTYLVKERQQEQAYRRREQDEASSNKLEEDEKEEPDRLTLLLPQSKFACNGKKTGYYADEDLGCEVFHYCQENARHSWICPEGFTFHQVHLICMPPGGDNICEKSSDYHFVNDYLYKPLNLQEYQQKPNVTLVYSDRYYPENYRQRYDDEEDDRPIYHKHSVRVTGQPRLQQIPSTTFRPQTQLKQVFRSPEEINISLQQRRPQYTTSRLIDY